jgi:hypothetical protein
MIRTGAKCLSAAAAAGTLCLMSVAPASADTIASSTTCTNPYTGSQAGPSSFDIEVPSTAVVGESVPVTVSYTFSNNSGYAISDVNTFTQAITTTGTAQNPVTVTAGSQGAVANGSSITVTQSGTWTPDAAGDATFTLSDFSFTTVVLGLTIPVSCTFDATPGAVGSVVSAS